MTLPVTPKPPRVPYMQVAKRLGVCRRRLLTEFVRLGVLPRPDSALTWSEEEVVAARAWLYSDRTGGFPAATRASG